MWAKTARDTSSRDRMSRMVSGVSSGSATLDPHGAECEPAGPVFADFAQAVEHLSGDVAFSRWR